MSPPGLQPSRSKRMRKIFVAVESFGCEVDGRPVLVSKGDTVREGHPVLKGRESLFVVQSVRFDVEQATAAPGERRSVSVPRAGKPKGE